MIASLHEQMGENKEYGSLRKSMDNEFNSYRKIDKLDRDVIDDMIDTIYVL